MPKRCTICHEDAKFCIKDTSDYYCDECAKECFADITVLQKVEEQALNLKTYVENRNI